MVKDLKNWHFIKTPFIKGSYDESSILKNDDSYQDYLLPSHHSIVYCLHRSEYTDYDLKVSSKIGIYDAINKSFSCIDSGKELEVYAWHDLPITDFVKYEKDFQSYIPSLIEKLLCYADNNLRYSSIIGDIKKCSAFKILYFMSSFMNTDEYEMYGCVMFSCLKKIQNIEEISDGDCMYLKHLICLINNSFLDLIGFEKNRDAGKINNIRKLCIKAFNNKDLLKFLTRNYSSNIKEGN